jgi:hypothetical protein
MNPKKNHLLRKITLFVIGLTLILFLFFPHYEFWTPTDSGHWEEVYIYEDHLILIGLTPFYILFVFMLYSKNPTLKTISKVILFLLAILYFGFGLIAVGQTVQDYAPGPGAFLLLLLLPELVYLHYMDMWIKYNEENSIR